MEIIISQEDITQLPVDALIVAILPRVSEVTSVVDDMVRKVSGDLYTYQVARDRAIRPTIRTSLAKGLHQHAGKFRDVVFVLSEPAEQVYDIVTLGLEAADRAGCREIALAAGLVTFGATNSDHPYDGVRATVQAVRTFANDARSVQVATLVVNDDERLAASLEMQLQKSMMSSK